MVKHYVLFSQAPALNKRRMVGVGGKRRAGVQSKAQPKPEWNDYLTEPGKFALSKTEQLRRKQLAISKHNILHSDGIVPSRTLRSVSTTYCSSPANTTPTAGKKLLHESKDDLHISAFGDRSHSTSKDITSLDLLSPITPSVSSCALRPSAFPLQAHLPHLTSSSLLAHAHRTGCTS